MGQAESRDGSKRPSIGSNAEPKMGALGSAHHPVETRSSTPTPSLLTPKGSGRTKNRRSSLDDKYDTNKEGNNEHEMGKIAEKRKVPWTCIYFFQKKRIHPQADLKQSTTYLSIYHSSYQVNQKKKWAPSSKLVFCKGKLLYYLQIFTFTLGLAYAP